MAQRRTSWAATTMAAVLVVVSGGALAGMEQSTIMFNALPDTEMRRMAAVGAERLAPELPPLPENVVRDSTGITVTLTPWIEERKDREQRRYEALFEGTYVLHCLEPKKEQQGAQAQGQEEKKTKPTRVSVFFPYPANADTIPDATVTVDGKEPDDAKFSQRGVGFMVELLPGEKREIKVNYRAYGTEDFRYALEDDNRIRHLDFTLMTTDASRRPVIPLEVSLRPSEPLTLESGTYTAKWVYDNLLTGRDIIIEMPVPAVRTSLGDRSVGHFIPVAMIVVVLFALVLALAGKSAKTPLSTGEIVLVVLAVVVFYPMLVFLSRHLSVNVAFAASFVVTGVLVMSILRRERSLGFALRWGGFAMIAVLGLWSLAAIAGGAAGVLVTLSAVLLVGFAIRVAPALRSEVSPAPPPVAAPDLLKETWMEGEATAEHPMPEPLAAPVKPTPQPAPPERFCAYCGCTVEPDFGYCPRCGKSQALTVRCTECGFEICRECGPEYRFCPRCGGAIDLSAPAPSDSEEGA